MEKDLGLGVIGCGGFGLFALQQFVQVPGTHLAGMAGTARPAAHAAARRFGLEDVVEVERLLALDAVDIVYIATPPFLHYFQAKQALSAGKHVICEKPLALTTREADELIAIARQKDRLLVANLMQRYNRLFEMVSQLIERRLLGELLHGYFENYASDENLPADHWFWDREKSGGIFVEHGVHFFDLFAGWLAGGEVVAAQASRRKGSNIEDEVQCTARYRDGVHVNFYHGFQQTGRMDRQELRLVFERGDILLQGWVPTYARVHAIADEADTRGLCELFSGARLDVLVPYGPKERRCAGHRREFDVYQQFELHWGEGRQKSRVYCELLRDLMADQVAWIRDRRHVRKTTEENGGRLGCAGVCGRSDGAWCVKAKPQAVGMVAMIKRLATHLLVRPEDVAPSLPDWEVIGVFNPGVARHGNDTVILARVAERPRERRAGWTAHPRWSRDQGFVVDWVPNEHLETVDSRVTRHLHTGLVRLTFVSHLRVFRSRDGRTIENLNGPKFLPANEMEEFGLEDPRITWLDGRYYITYVAVSRHGPATALASTTDFNSLDRHGIIFCPENKDVVLLPERVNGQYIALHRPLGDMPFCPPEMWIARSPDLVHWGRHEYLFAGASDWEGGRVGAGAPPLATPEGWLEIYHGNRSPEVVGEVGAYCGGAMLLAKDEPGRVIAAGSEPILEPQLEFEKEGFVAEVVFPTGVVEEGNRLLVYYGASDKYCAMAELSRSDVMSTLQQPAHVP